MPALFWVLLTAMSAAGSDYESAIRKLESIEQQRAAPNSTVTLTDAEVNAYARVAVQEVAPGAVREPKVELRTREAVGRALIDFEKLQTTRGKKPGTLMGWLLRGERPVSVAVRIESDEGRCRIDIQRVEVSGIPIEGRMLEFLIDNFLRPLYPEAAIGEPFELRHRIRKIDVQPGRVDVRIGR
jgi:hypothetical protein